MPATHDPGSDRRGAEALDAVGIGSMVVDRVHRVGRIVAADEKGLLRDTGPEGPVRVAVGGVVLNHLGWAALLGLRVGIFGRQGDDEGGRFLRAAMDRAGIVRDIRVVDEPSSLAEIFVDDAGARAIYMARGATGTTSAEHVRSAHAGFVGRAATLTTEVSQLPLAAALAAQGLARDAGAGCWVDLDVPTRDALAELGSQAELDALLSGATLLKPSKAALPGWVEDAGGDALALARAVRRRFGNEVVVVTAGEAGCAICSEASELSVPPPAIRPVDTTGAGDAFLGGLLVARSRGLDFEAAARLANACGAACCEQLGAFPEDAERARARVAELYGSPLPVTPE
ncbi:MAG: carbohydrate kinase family protein [Myxococcota bacterium]